MIVSVSGPSKSGKTTLIRKMVSQDNLIHGVRCEIKAPDDLWTNVVAWMGGPVETTITSASKTGGTVRVSGVVNLAFPMSQKVV